MAGGLACNGSDSGVYESHRLTGSHGKWSIPMFKSLLPRIYLIVDEINRRWLRFVRKRFPMMKNWRQM